MATLTNGEQHYTMLMRPIAASLIFFTALPIRINLVGSASALAFLLLSIHIEGGGGGHEQRCQSEMDTTPASPISKAGPTFHCLEPWELFMATLLPDLEKHFRPPISDTGDGLTFVALLRNLKSLWQSFCDICIHWLWFSIYPLPASKASFRSDFNPR